MSSDIESDWDSDNSSEDCESLSISKKLLDVQQVSNGTSSTSLMQTVSIHVPIIVSTMFTHRKRPHGGSVYGREYKKRDRQRHEMIMNDYFKGDDSKYKAGHFRRRFRMDVELFKHILGAIGDYDPYFTPKVDAVGNPGVSPLQKMLAAIRMLSYGCAADSLDEYIQIGESTTIQSLEHFCDTVIDIFEEEYLRKPNKRDVDRLLEEGDERGFPGMLGSLDCMHWKWKNCPTAWHGSHKNGFKGAPTLILEVVASKNLRIWHAFFGMAGTNNDINVLDRSPLFDDIVSDSAPPCKFKVNDHQYHMGYYLSDGIYPRYATLIQSISHPSIERERTFAKYHEAVRKDVERAFGVLQNRWHIVKGPARMWKTEYLGKIMKTCIILHNMIIESEHSQGMDPEDWTPPPDERIDRVNLEHDNSFLVSTIIGKLQEIRSETLHCRLKSDLINHVWKEKGNGNI